MILKSKILILSHYKPAYKAGGPIHSIENICLGLKSKVDITVISPSSDIDGTKLDIESYWKNRTQDINIFYKENLSLYWLYNFIKTNQFDCVYLNSFFTPIIILKIIASTIFFNTKIIIAPRGQLSDGAISNKNVIKSIYIKCFRYLIKNRIYRFHSTSNQETNEIIKRLNLKHNKIFQASNIRILTINKDIFTYSTKKKDELRLVFFSRIVFKKNLLFILNTLKNYSENNVYLDIYGTIEDSKYWDKCLNVIKELPNNINCSYKGVLHPDNVIEKLSAYDAMVLPTLNENFGHVIIEALYSGIPVILSPYTPFSKIVEFYKIGYVCSLSSERKLLDIIHELSVMPRSVILNMKSEILNYLSIYKTEQNKLIYKYEKFFNDIKQ